MTAERNAIIEKHKQNGVIIEDPESAFIDAEVIIGAGITKQRKIPDLYPFFCIRRIVYVVLFAFLYHLDRYLFNISFIHSSFPQNHLDIRFGE